MSSIFWYCKEVWEMLQPTLCNTNGDYVAWLHIRTCFTFHLPANLQVALNQKWVAYSWTTIPSIPSILATLPGVVGHSTITGEGQLPTLGYSVDPIWEIHLANKVPFAEWFILNFNIYVPWWIRKSFIILIMVAWYLSVFHKSKELWSNIAFLGGRSSL